ncbi:hypothetical protein HN385_07860 [archaeon]|jgi:hypothetical protein|nr:hypothetical protein [archaeon]
MMQLTYESLDSLGRKLLLIKKKNIKYNQDQVLKVLELLEDEKLHAQEIAKQTEFSARQIKKLRYIKRHMIKVEFDVLMTTKYYISSIEKYIKHRIKKERKYNDNKRRLRK